MTLGLPMGHPAIDVTSFSVHQYQLTIADIKTASVIEHVVRLCEDAPQVSEELTPAIWAVKTNLEKNPKYQEWRASEQYRQYTATNIGFIGF